VTRFLPIWLPALAAFMLLGVEIMFEDVLDQTVGVAGAHRFLLVLTAGLCIAITAGGLTQRSHLRRLVHQLYGEKISFFNQISHQLRTPLTSIVAYSELLLESPPEDEAERRRFLNVIHEEGTHLSGLVQQLSLLARFEVQRSVGAVQAVDLAALVQSVVEALRPQADRQAVTLTCAVAPDLPEMAGEAAALRNLVANLVENAIKYNRPQGHVRVMLRNEPPWFILTVSDTGLGIPSEIQSRIFEPFYRQEVAEVQGRPGSGLGLSVVRRAVDWHGGQIVVRSAPGEGSQFTIRLPQMPTPDRAGRTARTPRQRNRRAATNQMPAEAPTGEPMARLDEMPPYQHDSPSSR
jgi:signal transduction histidine kinase